MALFQKSVLNQYLKQLDKSKVDIAYQKFKAHFHNTTIQQHIRDSKEEQYQGEFLIDLFVNVLGYTKNPQPNFNLQTEQKNETDSKKADGAILKDGNVIAVIELKGTNTTDLNTVTPQAFGYKNNQKNCKYVLISNFEKLRFYIDNAIDFEEFNLFTLTENEFTLLYLCLHCDNLLNDLPNKIKQASTVKEENITKQLYKDYSDLKRKLFTDIVHLNPQYDKLVLFKKSQKLLDRILFILFAEDRGLLQANTIQSILDDFDNLKKLDVYLPLYDRFKKHFTYLNEGFKNEKYDVYGYNGGLFAPDEILDSILISDNLLQNYIPTLSKYDYDTEIDVNILGHIFEHSLNDIEEIQAELDGKEIDKTKTKRKKDGVFYTPKYITKYIVENTVGALCTEKRNEFEVIADNYTPDKRKAKKKELLQKLDTYQNWLLQITIVDPACGSGAFLNQALDFLIQEHKSIDELRAQLLGHSFIIPDHEVAILENNIFGVDLNEESVEIARLSLWLHTARKGRKLNSLNNNIKCGNSLIDDATIAGDKAFNWQNEFPTIFERGGFDVVIGNPPYVNSKGEMHTNSFKEFCIKKYKTAVYQIDTYLLFIEQSMSLINQRGFISLIIPNAWLNNLFLAPVRKFLLENTAIDAIVKTPKNTFSDANVDTVILTLKKKTPNNQISFFSLESQQLDFHTKCIQSEFLTKKDFLISYNTSKNFDFIMNKIESNSKPLSNLLSIARGVGLYHKRVGHTKDFIEQDPFFNTLKKDETFVPYLRGKNISRYKIIWENDSFISYGKWLAEPREPKYFEDERVLLRQIPGLNHLFATFIKEKFIVDQSVFIGRNEKFIADTKYITAILSSRLIGWYFRNKYSEFDDLFPKVKLLHFKDLPIKNLSLDKQVEFSKIVDLFIIKNKELQTIKSNVVKLLQSQYPSININTKLNNWNELSFKDFSKELEKQKIKLTISEKAELMQYFEVEQTKANTIQQTITQTDKEIDAMVYKLYELTDEEIAIVESA